MENNNYYQQPAGMQGYGTDQGMYAAAPGVLRSIDFDPDEMKKTDLKLLAVVAVIGVILIPIGLLADYTFAAAMGVIAIITAIGYGLVLLVNLRRVLKRVVFTTDGFYVNDEYFPYIGQYKMEVKPFFPIAGQADNVYLTVTWAHGKRRYWAGVKGDTKAASAREDVKNEIRKLTGR